MARASCAVTHKTCGFVESDRSWVLGPYAQADLLHTLTRMGKDAFNQTSRDPRSARFLPHIHSPKRAAMPLLFAVVELEARDAHQPAPIFGAEHEMSVQSLGEERKRPAALVLEGRAEGRGVPFQTFQADGPKRFRVSAGQASYPEEL